MCVCLCVWYWFACALRPCGFNDQPTVMSLTFARYYAGQKEYEVELQFSSGLTGHPDRLKTGWEDNRDGEDPVPGSSSDVSSEFGASQG